MTVPVPRCRGFTNPVLVLIRTSLETSIQQSGRTTSRAPLQWTGRSLTTSRSLRARPSSKAKATAAITPRPTQPKPAQPSSPGAALARNLQAPQIGYAQSLASKSTPTILYEAAPQRAFLISSYAAGLFGVMAGGINVWFNVYNVPEGTSFWVSYVFGAVGFMMAALGTRFAMMPASIVRSITLLPAAAAATAQSAKAGAGAAAKAASAARPVLLEVKARRTSPFPFVPLKRMQVEPQQVVMKTRLFTPPKTEPSPYEKIVMKREEERRRKEAQQYEMDHLMTAPFRDGARAAGTIFARIRQGLTGEGFMPIEVNGAKYKLDVTGGYALEDGRALDRIVKIEEDPGVVRVASQTR
ncbi:hypothetical protein DL769_002981 [Monosporascus sp. CRB-8-3]|nr:hypothetical protein DL769_002981 [Monosporascus sp. CRB-8-3]